MTKIKDYEKYIENQRIKCRDSILFIISTPCQWEYKEKCMAYYNELMVYCLLYTPIQADKKFNRQENNRRWHQIIRAIK